MPFSFSPVQKIEKCGVKSKLAGNTRIFSYDINSVGRLLGGDY